MVDLEAVFFLVVSLIGFCYCLLIYRFFLTNWLHTCVYIYIYVILYTNLEWHTPPHAQTQVFLGLVWLIPLFNQDLGGFEIFRSSWPHFGVAGTDGFSFLKSGSFQLQTHHFSWQRNRNPWDLGGGFKYFYFTPNYLVKWSNLTNIFQMGWNHQLEMISLQRLAIVYWDVFFSKKTRVRSIHWKGEKLQRMRDHEALPTAPTLLDPSRYLSNELNLVV